MNLNLFPTPEETIHHTAAAIAAGKQSCVETLERCLARIDSWEPTVHAWVSVDRDGARKVAEERDRELAQGKHRGPLHGIPIGIKDIINVAGWPTACGSELLARETASGDACVVERLRAAGAIILGKTVTTQFASFDPPVTRNPWNAERTPGGSSSGSAAATATGMCLGAIGSQTGGSITRPASFCGVAGCKPTWGRVSTRGVYPLSPNMDHVGPIARCVRDLALLLDAIAGFDAADPLCDRAAMPSLSSALDQPLSVPRIGRLRGMFDSLAEPAARAAVENVLSTVGKAGADIADAKLPARFDGVLKNHRAVMACETATHHRERIARFPNDYKPHIRALIEEGMALSATDYIRCRQDQIQLSREFMATFDDVDVLACPSTVGPAPDTSTTGNPSFNSPWSYLGLPTITIPIALDNGLPLGLQLIARRFDEPTLFRTAAWIERHVTS